MQSTRSPFLPPPPPQKKKKINLLTPAIWLFILPSTGYTFSLMNIKNFNRISLSILITRLLDDVWILKGEVTC